MSKQTKNETRVKIEEDISRVGKSVMYGIRTVCEESIISYDVIQTALIRVLKSINEECLDNKESWFKK